MSQPFVRQFSVTASKAQQKWERMVHDNRTNKSALPPDWGVQQMASKEIAIFFSTK
jgi:hypothetical protein